MVFGKQNMSGDFNQLRDQCRPLLQHHQKANTDSSSDLSRLHWSLGRIITTTDSPHALTHTAITHLAADFFSSYSDIASESQFLACLLPWGQNRLILDRVHRPADHLRYLRHVVRPHTPLPASGP